MYQGSKINGLSPFGIIVYFGDSHRRSGQRWLEATLPEGTHVQEMYPQFSKGFYFTEDGDVILTRRLCGAGNLTCYDLIFA